MFIPAAAAVPIATDDIGLEYFVARSLEACIAAAAVTQSGFTYVELSCCPLFSCYSIVSFWFY